MQKKLIRTYGITLLVTILSCSSTNASPMNRTNTRSLNTPYDNIIEAPTAILVDLEVGQPIIDSMDFCTV